MKSFYAAISDIAKEPDILKSNHFNVNDEKRPMHYPRFGMPISEPEIIATHFNLTKRNFNYQIVMPIEKE